MDTAAPPPDRRSSQRAAGSAKSRAAQPNDPRKQAPSGNGSRSGSGNGSGNGKRPGQARAHGVPAAKKAVAALAPSIDPGITPRVAAASTDVTELELPPDTAGLMPLLLPPIVPASPTQNESAPAETGSMPRVVAREQPAESETLPSLPPNTLVVPVVPAGEFTDTDGTDGLPSLHRPKKPPRALRAPVVRPRRAPRVRRVTRVVRHVDTWSVFKVALVFNLFLYGVCLTAGVLLWQVAQNTGTVDNVERFFESFGWERFDLKGGEIFHNSWIAGLFLVVGLTGLAVLMATMFNLITDLVGGIRVSVLEEEVVAREDRGLGWRRSNRRAMPTVPPASDGLSAPLPADATPDHSQPG